MSSVASGRDMAEMSYTCSLHCSQNRTRSSPCIASHDAVQGEAISISSREMVVGRCRCVMSDVTRGHEESSYRVKTREQARGLHGFARGELSSAVKERLIIRANFRQRISTELLNKCPCHFERDDVFHDHAGGADGADIGTFPSRLARLFRVEIHARQGFAQRAD